MFNARQTNHQPIRRFRLAGLIATAAALLATPAIAAPAPATTAGPKPTVAVSPTPAPPTTHSTYYTLDMQPPGTAGPSLFLTATSTGKVMLQPYVSGELRQQWAPVWPTWPRTPDITSSDPFSDFAGAFVSCILGAPSGGCPFHGATGSPRKFVNRMYAMCLTLSVPGEAFYARVKPCGRNATANVPQTFSWGFTDAEVAAGVPAAYTPIAGTRGGKVRCLEGKYDRHLPDTEAQSAPCRSPLPFRQQFRFLEVADVTCTLLPSTTLCGMGAPLQ
jgi:hypothetical protein